MELRVKKKEMIKGNRKAVLKEPKEKSYNSSE